MVDTLITVKKLFKANFTQMNRHETFFKIFALEILKKITGTFEQGCQPSHVLEKVYWQGVEMGCQMAICYKYVRTVHVGQCTIIKSGSNRTCFHE